MTSAISSFWEDYNSEESWKPLYYPFCFFAASYLYKQIPSQKKVLPWHEWHELHNVHNMGAVLLGWISLYFQDDAIFNERVVILFNFSYFLVDLVDTASRLDYPYVMHAVICLVLGSFNYRIPLHRELRMNSKAAQLEISSPFLHVAKRTKNPIHFVLFALSFTLCRIVWVPIMLRQLMQHGVEWNDIRLLILMAFYGLNLFWYSKIIKILVDGLRSKTPKDDAKEKKKDS